jgi:hypothetical protein
MSTPSEPPGEPLPESECGGVFGKGGGSWLGTPDCGVDAAWLMAGPVTAGRLEESIMQSFECEMELCRWKVLGSLVAYVEWMAGAMKELGWSLK